MHVRFSVGLGWHFQCKCMRFKTLKVGLHFQCGALRRVVTRFICGGEQGAAAMARAAMARAATTGASATRATHLFLFI